ncbi:MULTISPECIES: AAA family ATPase [unclassified Modicisalibacter]|uniref:AAA family ATPase n=1 Tax=unclassified Modicisalibacter TaxID=2679913 RepID=UPI001CCEB977|nr:MULTISPECIES: AAA family ATPase [unclassified Modicisalibacter]MBZ9560259.1 AAA family ATPase [Modicisalibacter sp. R2A 31.J]MBZ9576168.1 AAA family ATPase [Modicisalibacter sp. MOD 31.J]
MRILALRLANLASLPGPLELDFASPPLADAGLFAITGPTGAGKSTLLDALCLALYGNTPRLRLAPQRDSQLDDAAGTALTTSDPRTLLRRGTASGHAEVDFVGRDGRRYRARWAVRRARDKADGRLQAVEQSLRDLDDDRLLTAQKREFDRLLPERLGLTFEQFTRAVLLAQSEFAAFLQADDNARSDLLERLTGTAEYSAISMAAFRRASEAKKRVEALETRLADDLPAEPAARADLERRARAAQDAFDAVQRDARGLEAREQWHASDERLRDAVTAGRRRQQAAEDRWQSLAPVREDQAWRRVILPQRHRLTRQAELPGELDALEAAHQQTQGALADAESARDQAGRAFEAAERTLAQAAEARRTAEPALREARELAMDLANLDHQLAQLEKTQAERQAQRDHLETDHQKARTEHRQRRQQHADWQATLQQLLGEHDDLETARQAHRSALERAHQRQLALEELASHWREYQRALTHHQRLFERVQADEPRLARLLEQGRQARRRLDDAQARHDTVTGMIERSRAARSDGVVALRETLVEDAPCPVCGGLEHPWRHHPPASPEAEQLAAQQREEERQRQEVDEALTQAKQARDRLFGEYSALDASLKQARQELQSAERQCREARDALARHPLHGELATLEEDQRDTWLAEQSERAKADHAHHDTILGKLNQAEARIEPLRQALQEDATRLARFETRREGLDTELQALAEQLPPLRQRRDDRARALAARLGEHASPDAWQQHLDARQENARQAREAAQTHRHETQREHQRLAQQAAHEAERLATLTHERDTLNAELAEWRRTHAALDEARLARLLAQADDAAERQRQQLEDADHDRQQAAASLAERRQALLDHRRDQQLLDGAADDAALLDESAEAEIVRRREALEHEREALAPRLDAAQQQRDEAVHALRDDDRRRQRHQDAQAELQAARSEFRRWGRISELIGSADGKAFRRIAQAYNLEQLLEHANVHLAGLSRRYRLVRGGSELGLLVIDRDMADERRSVHSLSGGETFLVSLALALGLASMASGELAIESLFIDEGFGSLDPESLALAMDALDGLQALGRRVGVISHVPEMHERIPVQIRIEPEGNGTSRARLVSE